MSSTGHHFRSLIDICVLGILSAIMGLTLYSSIQAHLESYISIVASSSLFIAYWAGGLLVYKQAKHGASMPLLYGVLITILGPIGIFYWLAYRKQILSGSAVISNKTS
jgi:hypothetical protein